MAPLPKLPPIPHRTSIAAEESVHPRPTFPLSALGPRLSPAMIAAAHHTQAPVELVAHDLLTLAAMATQRLISLRLPAGGDRPVSCFFVSMTGRDDSRRAVEKTVIDAARLWERGFEDEYPARVAAHMNNRTVAGVQEPEPLKHLDLFYDARDPHSGNRYRSYLRQAGFFARHPHDVLQPSAYRRAEAESLCRLWNGLVIRREKRNLFPRLSLHLAAGPHAVKGVLSDPELAESGVLDRMLLAAPPSRLGSRTFAETRDDAADVEMDKLLDYLGDLFEKPATASTRLIGFSKEAAAAWLAFARETETAIAPGGAYAPIPAFASFLAEHAARLAAVIAFMSDWGTEQIDTAHLERGIALARFYAEERLRLQRADAPEATEREKEDILREWLQRTKAEKDVTLRDICRTGPKGTRDVDTAYKMMRRMERLGIVQPANPTVQGTATPRRQREQYIWRVEKETGQGVA